MEDNLIGIETRRKQLGLSQTDLAERLAAIDPDGAWDQTKVSRYERRESSIPLPALLVLLRVLGEDLLQVPKPNLEGVPEGASFSGLTAELTRMLGAAEAEREVLGDTLSDEVAGSVGAVYDHPRIAFFGKYDAGKSTAINAAIGGHLLPTSYQPQTQFVTYIRHVDLRPRALGQAEAVILDAAFDPRRWHEVGSSELNNHELARGGMEILHREPGSEIEDAGAIALVFLDAPILRSCTLIDTPGSLEDFQEDDGGTNVPEILAYEGAVICDSYLSFLNRESLQHAESAALQLDGRFVAPLQRLLILVTHAHARLSDAELESITHVGAKRLARQLAASGPHLKGDWSASSIEARCSAFDPEHASRSSAYATAFAALVGSDSPIAAQHVVRVGESIESLRTITLGMLHSELDSARAAGAAATTKPSDPEEYDERIRALLSDAMQDIDDERTASRKSAFAIAARYDDAVIEKVIRDKFPNKKDARENAAPWVYTRITAEVTADLEPRVDRISKQLSDFVERCEADLPKFSANGRFRTFDARARLIGAALGASAGAAGAGAAAAYAATLGNLGAYILVAKGVSILSGLGISVGGVAPATAFIAAIGGPITLVVVSVALLTTVGLTIARGSWEKVLAKDIRRRVVDEILFKTKLSKKHPVTARSLPEELDRYWEEVKASFDRAAAEAMNLNAEMHAAPRGLSAEARAQHLVRLQAAIDWVTEHIQLNAIGRN